MRSIEVYYKGEYNYSQYRPKKAVQDINELTPLISDLYNGLQEANAIIRDLATNVIKSDLWISEAQSLSDSIDTINNNLKSTTTMLLKDIDDKFTQIAQENSKLAEKVNHYREKLSNNVDLLAGVGAGTAAASILASGATTATPLVYKEEGTPTVNTGITPTTVSNSASPSVSAPSNNLARSADSANEVAEGPVVEEIEQERMAGVPNEANELSATSVQYNATPNNSSIDISKYHSNPDKGFVVTTDNPTYNLSEGDLELLTAIVSAESDKSYDDALAVASTILNRCEEPKWSSCGGNNPVKQATAPNQFVVYQHGSYKKFMGNGAPDTCKQAVLDALNGARNHDYLSFRSNGSSRYSSNMITATGNRYK